MTIRSVLAAASLALTIAPAAQAAILIEIGAAAATPEETLLFDGSTGVTLIGLTDPLGEQVSVFGGETLLGGANRSRVWADDLGLDAPFTFKGLDAQTLAFDLTGPGRAFTSTEFFIVRGRGTATHATLTFVDTGGLAYQQVVRLGRNGVFNARAIDGQKIDYFSMAFNGSVQDVRDIRFGGLAAIPEPAAWGMMIVGFGGVGAALRGRRSFRVA